MHVFVPGGAGYIGSLLVPALIEEGYDVTVYDLFLQGRKVFSALKDHPRLTLVKGDIRDLELMEKALNGSETILHLACSLESLEIDPFVSFVQIAKRKVANRFIFTSSFASHENLENHTPYAKFKTACEKTLLENRDETLSCTILRPGMVFDSAPCMRPNNIINLFEEKDRFKCYPMVHIRDLISVYLEILKTPAETLQGEIYNVGYQTLSLAEIRDRVNNKSSLPPIKKDLVSSKKIAEHLGFFPKFTIEDGIQELLESAHEELPLSPLQPRRAPYFSL